MVNPILPTAKHKPRTNLRHYIWFLYGPPKIGKTTLLSQITDALIVATEQGTSALEVFETKVTSWSDFTTVLDELSTNKEADKFKAVCIDTVGILWDLLCSDICKRRGWEHISEPGFAEGYDMAKVEMTSAISKLRSLDKLIVFVAHERRTEELDDNGKRTGTTMITCDLPGSARKVFLGQSDFVTRAFLDDETDEDGKNLRSLRLQPFRTPDEYIECGCRGSLKRQMPETISLSFKSFVREFQKAFSTPKKRRSAKSKTNQVNEQPEASA